MGEYTKSPKKKSCARLRRTHLPSKIARTFFQPRGSGLSIAFGALVLSFPYSPFPDENTASESAHWMLGVGCCGEAGPSLTREMLDVSSDAPSISPRYSRPSPLTLPPVKRPLLISGIVLGILLASAPVWGMLATALSMNRAFTVLGSDGTANPKGLSDAIGGVLTSDEHRRVPDRHHPPHPLPRLPREETRPAPAAPSGRLAAPARRT